MQVRDEDSGTGWGDRQLEGISELAGAEAHPEWFLYPLNLSAGRTNTRSGWAAQLAVDAGLQRCLVLRQGVCGWRLDPAVKPYRGYKLQGAPPEAEPFSVEPLNAEAGRHELAQLGIPVM